MEDDDDDDDDDDDNDDDDDEGLHAIREPRPVLYTHHSYDTYLYRSLGSR